MNSDVIAAEAGYMTFVTFAVALYVNRLYGVRDIVTLNAPNIADPKEAEPRKDNRLPDAQYLYKLARYHPDRPRRRRREMMTTALIKAWQEPRGRLILVSDIGFVCIASIPFLWLWWGVNGGSRITLNPAHADLSRSVVSILTLVIVGVHVGAVVLIRSITNEVRHHLGELIARIDESPSVSRAVLTKPPD